MKRTVVILILTLTALFGLSAQGGVPTGQKERPKVGLVLSGGGAKGVAHIKVLQVLEEAGMPIDYIAGTSMGAIIGGLYSIGYTPHEMDSMVRTQDWLSLISDRVARDDKRFYERESADTYILSVPMSLDTKFALPSGVTAGQNVLNLLNEMTIGYHDKDIDFNEMPIPYACVAYDMVKGEEYVFRSGNLPTAIRASMSIPGAFAPVLLDSMVLVDGGIYNNFPVDVVKKMGAEIIIGVDLTAGIPELAEINSIFGMVDQVATIIGREKYDENRKNTDLYINPRVKPYTSASFTAEAIDTLLVRGETAAREKWDEILALKDEICGADYVYQKIQRSRMLDVDSISVGAISFSGLSMNEEPLIRYSLGLEENTTITKQKLNNSIERLRGSGAFSYVTYTLDSKPPYNMVISVNEKQEGVVNLGFRFDTEEMASILLGTTLNFRGLMGPRLDAQLRLNENPYIKLDFNSSRWFLGRFGISYMYKYNKFTFYDHGKNPTRITFDQHKVDLFFNNFNPDKFSVNVGVQYEYFNYQSFLWSTDPSDMAVIVPKGFINYFAKGHYENMDDYYYPTKGYRVNTQLMLHTDNAYQFEKELPFASVQYSFQTAISYNNRLTFTPSVYGRTLIGNFANKENYFAYLNALGGELNGRYVTQQMVFPGIRNIEYFDNSLIVASLEVRMRLFKRNYISVKGAFGLQNNNFFKMFIGEDFQNKHIWGIGIKYSYNSPIGPISLQLDTSNINKGLGIYVSVGKNF